jgi:DNA processing protein
MFDEAVQQQESMRRLGVALIPVTHPAYPPKLREIYDPPIVLFARGRLDLLQTLGIAVVGTRRPTAYGLQAARRMATDLALAGITIVSGMARGIDTAAHSSAIEAAGNTIAVFGCGADVIYPAENRKLASQICDKGLILSEFPMGAPSYPQNFPVRNRIVAGMTSGVLVVEGAQYSGSGITARLAMDQGREVFAIPGPITSPQSWGPNLLIKQGAKLVQEFTDILQELTPEERLSLRALASQDEEAASIATVEHFDPNAPVHNAILHELQFDKPVHLDHLIEGLEGTSPSEVIAALFEMELQGRVRQLPGKQYIRVWG